MNIRKTEEDKRIAVEIEDNKVIDKNIYSSCNKELIDYIEKNNIKKIYLCGVDTECCVLKTAIDLFENNYDVYVLKDYCACTHGQERNNNALNIIGRCIGRNKII